MNPSELTVRKAIDADIPVILKIFENAKRFMRSTGNMEQWSGGYPEAATVKTDIDRGHCYVVVSRERVVGTFCLIHGQDPTYAEIEGRWIEDGPYATVHRIASDGSTRGVADCCLEFAMSQTPSLRIDTHEHNRPMLNWLGSRGFSRCGTIRLADGSPRIAFQISNPKGKWTQQQKSR